MSKKFGKKPAKALRNEDVVPARTPLEDQKSDSLQHYDYVSRRAVTFRSDVPVAIKFYYDTLIEEERRSKVDNRWEWAITASILISLIMILLISLVK